MTPRRPITHVAAIPGTPMARERGHRARLECHLHGIVSTTRSASRTVIRPVANASARCPWRDLSADGIGHRRGARTGRHVPERPRGRCDRPPGVGRAAHEAGAARDGRQRPGGRGAAGSAMPTPGRMGCDADRRQAVASGDHPRRVVAPRWRRGVGRPPIDRATVPRRVAESHLAWTTVTPRGGITPVVDDRHLSWRRAHALRIPWHVRHTATAGRCTVSGWTLASPSDALA